MVLVVSFLLAYFVIYEQLPEAENPDLEEIGNHRRIKNAFISDLDRGENIDNELVHLKPLQLQRLKLNRPGNPLSAPINWFSSEGNSSVNPIKVKKMFPSFINLFTENIRNNTKLLTEGGERNSKYGEQDFKSIKRRRNRKYGEQDFKSIKRKRNSPTQNAREVDDSADVRPQEENISNQTHSRNFLSDINNVDVIANTATANSRDNSYRSRGDSSDNSYRSRGDSSDNSYRSRGDSSDNSYRSLGDSRDNSYRSRGDSSDNSYRSRGDSSDNSYRSRGDSREIDDSIFDINSTRNSESVVDINSMPNYVSVVDRNDMANVLPVAHLASLTNVTGHEQHNLVFLKVHKAASTTVHNIIMRFALSRSLDVMLPRTANILSETGYLIKPDRLHPYPPDLKFLVVCNHIIFNKDAIAKHLRNPGDTFYVGIVREPFSQFTSAFYFYLNTYKRTTLVNIALDRPEHPIRGFLENPLKYAETPDYAMSVSFINNRMSADFGFPMWILEKTKHDSKLVQRFLKMTEETFDLVMVVDMFDESIVLFRRLLRWKLKDMLYVRANSLDYSKLAQTVHFPWKVNTNFTEEDRRLHQLYAPVDHALYNHFRNILLEKLKSQPPDFMDEVMQFKLIQREVNEFCNNNNETTASELTVLSNRWTEEFKINSSDCVIIQMGEMDLVMKAREMQVSRYSSKA